MKALITLMVVLALTGCGATLQPKNVSIPASLTQKCQPLHKLDNTTGEALLRNIVANSEVYHRCAGMHSKLVEAVAPERAKP